MNIKNYIRATGHHLEWIAVAPLDCRPNQACIVRAARVVAADLLRSDRLELIESYGPITHAVRGLLLLADEWPMPSDGGMLSSRHPSNKRRGDGR